MKIENIIDRVSELYDLHDRALPDRNRFRNILNGGSDGIRELLGNTADTTSGELPAPNLLLSALDRIAQKIGRVPNLEIPLAVNKDSVRAKDRRDKLERIVNAYDEHQKLDMQLPQVGRWLPGYGFAVWTIKTKYGPNGVPYPCAELRDPYDCYPGYYGVGQDPHELAIIRRVPPPTLVKMYPELKPYYDTKNRRKAGSTMLVGTGNMNSNDEPRWETQKGGDVIVEYMEETGTYVVHPGANKLLDFIPNPLKSGPQFVVAKRFSFDKLQGQFDQVIGLMSAMAKINIMSVIAMEDAVFTETNVIGELESGQYRKGRHAINYLSPGTQVVKPVNNLPYQLFDQVSRLERQLILQADFLFTISVFSSKFSEIGHGVVFICRRGRCRLERRSEGLFLDSRSRFKLTLLSLTIELGTRCAVQNGVQTFLQFFVGLELIVGSEGSKTVFLLPDALKLIIIEVTQGGRTIKFRFVVVPVTSNLLDLQFEVSTLPQIEGVHRSFVLERRLHCFHDLVKDLLAEAIEEHFTLVLRVGRIFNDVDVAVVVQLTLLLTCNLFVRIQTRVPQLPVQVRDRIFLAQSRQGVLDIPTTRTLEGMTPNLCPGQVFALGCREEADDRITVTCFVYLRFPEALIGTAFGLSLVKVLCLRQKISEAGLFEGCK